MTVVGDQFDNLAAQLDFSRLSRPQRQSVDSADEPSSIAKRTLGTALGVSMTLESGAEVSFNVREGIAGKLVDFTLESSQQLSEKEQQVFIRVIENLADAIDQLFSGEAAGQTDLFKSISDRSVGDLDVSASQQTGMLSQQLTLEQETMSKGEKRLSADWQQRDLDSGIEDRHGFKLSKKPGVVAQTYGQVGTNWLQAKLAAATNVTGNTRNLAGGLQSDALSSFYGSGLNALLQVTNDGARALEDIGASPDQAQRIVGRTISALSQHAHASAISSGSSSMSDFDAVFTSNREKGARDMGPDTYQLSISLSQKSRESFDEDTDAQYISQKRTLEMSYRTETEEQILSLNWNSEESQRYKLTNGQINSSGRQREELLTWIIEDANGRSSGSEKVSERDFSVYGDQPSGSPFMQLDRFDDSQERMGVSHYV